VIIEDECEKAGALKELGAAVKLAPESDRYAYVYATGLHSARKLDEVLPDDPAVKRLLGELEQAN